MSTSSPNSRILIGLKDYLLEDTTLVTGAGWAASSELNVKTNRFASVALATVNDTSLGVDLGAAAVVGVLTIPKHSLGTNSTYRVRLSNNSTLLTNPTSVPLGDILYDTTTTTVWPTEPFLEVPFDDYDEWSTTFVNVSSPAISIPCIDTTARYIYIEFSDPDSTSYTIAKLTIGPYWRPSGGLSPQWKQKHVSKKRQHKRLAGGGVFSEDIVKSKQLTFTLKTITEAEAFNQVALIDQGLAKTTPWLVLLDPQDLGNTYRLFMYGTNIKIKPIKSTFYGFYSKTYMIEEWV